MISNVCEENKMLDGMEATDQETVGVDSEVQVVILKCYGKYFLDKFRFKKNWAFCDLPVPLVLSLSWSTRLLSLFPFTHI